MIERAFLYSTSKEINKLSNKQKKRMATAESSKPTVLHLGDAIKYNHDFYNNEFATRFNVIQATETDRESFIHALKTKKCVLLCFCPAYSVFG